MWLSAGADEAGAFLNERSEFKEAKAREREPQSNRTNQNQTIKHPITVEFSPPEGKIDLSIDAHPQMAGKRNPARFLIRISMGTVCGQDHQ